MSSTKILTRFFQRKRKLPGKMKTKYTHINESCTQNLNSKYLIVKKKFNDSIHVERIFITLHISKYKHFNAEKEKFSLSPANVRLQDFITVGLIS